MQREVGKSSLQVAPTIISYSFLQTVKFPNNYLVSMRDFVTPRNVIAKMFSACELSPMTLNFDL